MSHEMSRKRRRSTGPPKNLAARHRQGDAPAAVGEERPGARRAAGRARRRPYAYDYREVLGQRAGRVRGVLPGASAIYLVNDARDVEADRRTRPSGSGRSRRVWCPVPGLRAGRGAAVASIGISFLATPNLAMVMAVYIGIQLAYCFGLKHQAVIDICIVSSGFLLRAIAGGVAADIPLSQWFLLIMAFGSLFMAAGKRYAELQLAERTGAKIRKSLENYTQTLPAVRLDVVGDRASCSATDCGRSSGTASTGHQLVRDLDGAVHHRDPALRGRRRRRSGGRARGDRARRPGAPVARGGLDRKASVSLSTSAEPARRSRRPLTPGRPSAFDVTARVSLWRRR